MAERARQRNNDAARRRQAGKTSSSFSGLQVPQPDKATGDRRGAQAPPDSNSPRSTTKPARDRSLPRDRSNPRDRDAHSHNGRSPAETGGSPPQLVTSNARTLAVFGLSC
jgi:hypothetical protein